MKRPRGVQDEEKQGWNKAEGDWARSLQSEKLP